MEGAQKPHLATRGATSVVRSLRNHQSMDGIDDAPC